MAATALLWLFATLSEHHTYTTVVQVRWEGVDTNRYVVVSVDTMLSFDIVSNGFLALSRAHATRNTPLEIAADSDTTLSPDDCIAALKKQFGFVGMHDIKCRQSSLSLRLSARECRPFIPRIRHVDVSFAHPYGLYGDLSVSPDTVWLYGSRASLDKIAAIETSPATIPDVRRSSTYRIALDPVWRAYPDLRTSADSVLLTIPTKRFAEKHFSVPVVLTGLPETVNVRLYPEQVDVLMWVAEEDFPRITEDDIAAEVRYDPYSDTWPVSLSTFPSQSRIKQIEPEAVSYILIR